MPVLLPMVAAFAELSGVLSPASDGTQCTISAPERQRDKGKRELLDPASAGQRLEHIGGDARNRTGDKGFAGPCLTAWPRRLSCEHTGACYAPVVLLPTEKKVDLQGSQKSSGRPSVLVDGADDGIRTRDPNLGKVVLYQLSHVRAHRLV